MAARLSVLIGRLRDWRPTGRQQKQAAQTAFAAALSYVIALTFGLPQGYWAVITAILVVQSSIGGSLGLVVDRLVATILGAVAGLALLYLFGVDRAALVASLALAVLLLAFVAIRRPGLRLAPVTAAIILLSDNSVVEPLVSALDRVGEIVLGSVVALATALLLWPSRAVHALAQQVAVTIGLIRDHLSLTIAGAAGPPRDDAAMLEINARLLKALVKGDALAVDARHELAGRLADHADPEALLRTLRRTWNTAVMAARAVRTTLPPSVAEPLRPSLDSVAAALRVFFDALAAAFAEDGPPPDLAPVETAIAGFADAIVELRRAALTRSLSSEELSRLFTFAFALDQLRQNLQDLVDRCQDLRRRR
jgi:uncharacterized membrane protein YccC